MNLVKGFPPGHKTLPLSVGFNRKTLGKDPRLKSQWYHGDSQNTRKVVLTSRIMGFYPTGTVG